MTGAYIIINSLNLIDFFVAKREKSGVVLTNSLGKWETIVVKRHYNRPCVIRLNGIDPCWSKPANDVRSHCTIGPDVTYNLGNRVSKIGNSKIFALS